jgi:hypothetical protein
MIFSGQVAVESRSPECSSRRVRVCTERLCWLPKMYSVLALMRTTTVDVAQFRIIGHFNDAFSCQDYVAFNER